MYSTQYKYMYMYSVQCMRRSCIVTWEVQMCPVGSLDNTLAEFLANPKILKTTGEFLIVLARSPGRKAGKVRSIR